jgi:transposase-like protein
MPWKCGTDMDSRHEFVRLAEERDVGIAELCRRFGISRQTGYLYLKRYKADGDGGLADRSSRPLNSPKRCAPELETCIRSDRGCRCCRRPEPDAGVRTPELRPYHVNNRPSRGRVLCPHPNAPRLRATQSLEQQKGTPENTSLSYSGGQFHTLLTGRLPEDCPYPIRNVTPAIVCFDRRPILL